MKPEMYGLLLGVVCLLCLRAEALKSAPSTKATLGLTKKKTAVAPSAGPRTKLKLGSKEIDVEIADTPEAREKGLMFRKSMGENEGMLFIFEEARPQGFWMRNTEIPLAIGFFDEKGELFQVIEMVPATPIDTDPPIYRSSKAARYALEMNKGWFAKNKVGPGAKLPPDFLKKH